MKKVTEETSAGKSEARPSGLDDLIQQGARQIVQQAIEAELAALLERYDNVKTLDGRRTVIRNGYLPEREVVTAIGPVTVKQAITRFYVEARADGSRINPAAFVLDSAGLQGGFSGEFVVIPDQLAGRALCAAARAWLNGRVGRRISLRIRETDVEAKDQEEFDRFLNQALTLALVEAPSEHSRVTSMGILINQINII